MTVMPEMCGVPGIHGMSGKIGMPGMSGMTGMPGKYECQLLMDLLGCLES